MHRNYCYHENQADSHELSIEEIRSLFLRLKQKGIIHMMYVGGEPTLRKNVLEECTNIFQNNWIITNGSIPPLELKNVYYGVSVDGSEACHDEIRGKGSYKRILENYSNRKKTFINVTLHTLNMHT